MFKIILFDIDYTLLDSNRLRKEIDNYICRYGSIVQKVLKQTKEQYLSTLQKSSDFSLNDYFRFLKKDLKENKLEEKLAGLFIRPNPIFVKSLYPETVPVLEVLRKKYRLGIFSEGDIEYQTLKLQLSGLIDRLDQALIFIYREKNKEIAFLAEKLGDLIIVDDNPETIQSLLTIKNVHPIWIKQGKKAESIDSLSAATINNISELPKKLLHNR